MAPPLAVAMSAIKTVQDCANYDVAVKPHLAQLPSFVPNLIHAISSLSDLQRFYTSTNPLVTAFCFSLLLAPVFLVVSEVNKNYSQVDRCWSLLPTVYAVHYAVWAHLADMPTQRVTLAAAVSVMWSVGRRPLVTRTQIKLTEIDTTDIQLLASGRLPSWFRRLPLEHH